MKLKTLVSTLAVAGLVTTGAFAAPVANNSQSGVMHSAFWQSVAVNPNQDNANGVVMLDKGMKVTGIGSASLSNHSDDVFGDVKGTQLVVDQAEVYLDAVMGNMATFHAASSLFNIFGDANKRLNFSEFNATLYHGNAWLTVGKQYGSFGSMAHHDITTPLTQVIAMHQTGLKLGYALTDTGLFGDVFVYNGQQKISDDSNMVRGYNATIGYAVNNGVNKLFDFNGFQVRASYASNIGDGVAGAQGVPTDTFVPGYSVFAQYTQNAFKLSGNYIFFNQDTGADDPNGSAHSLYMLQTEYRFMTQNARINSVILGYQGTTNMVAVEHDNGKVISWRPKSRVLVAYKYALSKNLTLEAQYNVDQDYSTSMGATGKSDDQIHARIRYTF